MLTRRGFVVGSLSSLCACSSRVAIRTQRPVVSHGVQAGDVGAGRALVWARCSEPARMIVEWDTTPRFDRPRRVAGPVVTPDTDHAASVALDGLPDAQTIAYRVRFEREAARGDSAWVAGRFATPRADRFRVAWTGDTCGQGFGRNPEWGGLRGFEAIRAAEPAVFVNSGDLIYADNPILAEQRTSDGRIWRNLTNERVARVAQQLDDFRARFAYSAEDEHVRALAAEVPVIAQWDDHETYNNWWPGQQRADPRYTQRDASTLAGFARRAMFEWTPIPPGPVHRVVHYGPLLDVVVLDLRSFRTPNDSNRGDTRQGDPPPEDSPILATRGPAIDRSSSGPGAMLGAAQAAWLVDTLAASRARWKLVACDQPLSLVIPDGDHQEGFANGDGGPPLGREHELAALLAGLAARAVHNVAWITADVHYAAAHRYDPARARFTDFDPFWEFVAGPIHAGTFGPEQLDPTFGPEVMFQWVPPPGTGNLAPWDGLQSFGTIDVTPDALVVSLLGIDGKVRHRVELPYRG